MLFGDLSNFWLGVFTDGEQRVLQLFLTENMQNIGLILISINCPQ